MRAGVRYAVGVRFVRALWPVWLVLALMIGPLWVFTPLLFVGLFSGGRSDHRRVVVRR